VDKENPKENWQVPILRKGSHTLPNGGMFSITQVSQPSFIAGITGDKPLYLSLDKIQFPLMLRPLQAGDRFWPFGCLGNKKISNYCMNRKIPPWERERSLVLCQNSRIVALLGHEIDHEYRLLKNQESALCIKNFSIDKSSYFR
jgi:tRNA(Ile)-lysidine synthetase-like protein